MPGLETQVIEALEKLFNDKMVALVRAKLTLDNRRERCAAFAGSEFGEESARALDAALQASRELEVAAMSAAAMYGQLQDAKEAVKLAAEQTQAAEYGPAVFSLAIEHVVAKLDGAVAEKAEIERLATEYLGPVATPEIVAGVVTAVVDRIATEEA